MEKTRGKKGPAGGDRISSYQKNLPKIALTSKQKVSDVPETPSPNTYMKNIQRQKSTNFIPPTPQTLMETDEVSSPTKTSGNTISIKPPPKKQKIDMSSFESAPKLERTNSGSVLTTLQGPVLKGESNSVAEGSHNNVNNRLQNENEPNVVLSQAPNGVIGRQQVVRSGNPFDMAFKTAVESPEKPKISRTVPSVAVEKTQDAPLTPLKTSDIPDIVQELQDSLAQSQSQLFTANTINGVTYLLPPQREAQGSIIVSHNQLASLIATSQASLVAAPVPQQPPKFPHRLISLKSLTGQDPSQQLFLLPGTSPGSAAASFQDVELFQPQINVAPMINNVGWRPSVVSAASIANGSNISLSPSFDSTTVAQSNSDNVSAKAKMREQLERKMNFSSQMNSQIHVQTSFSDGNSSREMSVTPTLTPNGLSSGSLAGNSLADSTTRPGEQDPKYSLTREKNREAAQRCREKRKKWIATIQDENKRLNTENSQLKQQVAMLHHELMDLKTRLLNEHSSLMQSAASAKLISPPRKFSSANGAIDINSDSSSLPFTSTPSSSGQAFNRSAPKPTLPFSDLILDGKDSNNWKNSRQDTVDVSFIEQNYIEGDKNVPPVNEQNHVDLTDSQVSLNSSKMDRIDSGIESDPDSGKTMTGINSFGQIVTGSAGHTNSKYIVVYQKPGSFSGSPGSLGRPSSTPLITMDDSFSLTSNHVISRFPGAGNLQPAADES